MGNHDQIASDIHAGRDHLRVPGWSRHVWVGELHRQRRHRRALNPERLGQLGVPLEPESGEPFIGARGDVDYLARKLQREGKSGRRWSAAATARALRRLLCERRLDHGREQIERRIELGDYDCGRIPNHLMDRYTEAGLPLFNDSALTWRPDRKRRIRYLGRDVARRLWAEIGELADEVSGRSDLFFDRVQQIDGFGDYVTDEPWQYGETEQTPEDRELREIVQALATEISVTAPQIGARKAFTDE